MEISVIVPVYNVEKYLYRCVESILNQSFKDYELILVDDGSTDKSGSICDELKEKDNRIKVIHKANGGLSEARNIGILSAQGKFVTYIDSDDYVANDYLSTLYSRLIKYNCDIACGGFRIFSDVNNNINDRRETLRECLYTGNEAFLTLLNGKLYTSSCNMLIKTEIARENLFPVGKYHEDEFTTYRYFISSNSVIVVDKDLYYYYQREGSIVHSFGKQVLDEIKAADNYCSVCEDFSYEFMAAALRKKYFMYLQILRDYPEIQTEYIEQYNQMKSFIKCYRWKVLLDINEGLKFKTKIVIEIFKELFW